LGNIQLAQRLRAVRLVHDLVPFILQIQAQQSRNIIIIFHQQDFFTHQIRSTNFTLVS